MSKWSLTFFLCHTVFVNRYISFGKQTEKKLQCYIIRNPLIDGSIYHLKLVCTVQVWLTAVQKEDQGPIVNLFYCANFI